MLESLVGQLDPHSSYIPIDKVQSTNETLEGSFEGVGIEYVMLADTLTIQSVIVGGPAEAVGLRPGDKIVIIDGESVAGTGLTTDGIRSRLRGPKGTTVAVTALRDDRLLDFLIRRDTIPIESIDAAYQPVPGIVYVKLSRFSQNSAEEFIEALRNVTKVRPDGIILDLRGNGGGYMHVASALANLFLPEGLEIVRMEGKAVERVDRSVDDGLYPKGPLVLLVDEDSASASEILAGALQDWDRAVIVGRRTFGKGLVQQQYPLSDGSEIRLTIARYHTPSGRMVQAPYEMGHRDAYFRQARDRYARGESFSRDSIVLPDSLQYKTLRLGRTVYGGGGIMPDVFVPYDTTGINRYLLRAINGGRFSEYAYEYIDKHREQFAAKDLPSFEKKWARLERPAFDGLIAFLAEKGIEPENDAELAACSPTLKTRLKAMMARSLFGTTAYWQIINREQDPEFQEALKIVRNWSGDFPDLP
jgi:carboxyl-terminal processing protease